MSSTKMPQFDHIKLKPFVSTPASRWTNVEELKQEARAFP